MSLEQAGIRAFSPSGSVNPSTVSFLAFPASWSRGCVVGGQRPFMRTYHECAAEYAGTRVFTQMPVFCYVQQSQVHGDILEEPQARVWRRMRQGNARIDDL